MSKTAKMREQEELNKIAKAMFQPNRESWYQRNVEPLVIGLVIGFVFGGVIAIIMTAISFIIK
jgi:hypothetical protein